MCTNEQQKQVPWLLNEVQKRLAMDINPKYQRECGVEWRDEDLGRRMHRWKWR